MPQLIASVGGVEIKMLYLTQDRTTLGRQDSNDIVLPDLTVSNHHCQFELEGLADVFVQDLGSTNGTFLNGKAVKREMLQDQDVLHLGRFKFQYFDVSEPLLATNTTTSMPLAGMEVTEEPQASLRVLTGSSMGLEIDVHKAVSTFGQPGVAVVAIAHRRQGYFVSLIESHLEPGRHAKINGRLVTSHAELLHQGDVLEIAGTTVEFVLRG